jgi:hypothetical protein
MPRKQVAPTRLNQLEDIKRKARASQEARLQETLNRLTKQEHWSSAATHTTATESYHLDPLRTTSKYYAVRRGRINNVIYVSWALCKSQVINYPGAEFKAFNTYESALEYLGAASQITERHNRQAHINEGSSSTATELAATVEASTQTTEDRCLRTHIEGIALGVIVGAIATPWILPDL